MDNMQGQPPSQEPPTQYGPDLGPQQPYGQPLQQWGQQPPQYGQPQQQWGQQQPPQYGQVPYYAQPQQNANNFWTRWIMMRLAFRLIIYILVPLLLCGGCALVVFLGALHP